MPGSTGVGGNGGGPVSENMLGSGGGGGAGGTTYGTSNLEQIYLGSPGANAINKPGGIIYINASVISITGTISSDGGDYSGKSGASSGGSIYITGGYLTLGSSLVTAPGGASGAGGAGGVGRIRAEYITSLSGTANPSASTEQLTLQSVTIQSEETNEYTVSFDGNTNTGGSVPSNIVQDYDTEVTVPDNTGSLTKTGYTFNGWNTLANGSGTTYVADDTFNMPVDGLTLYAKWTINEYTVTFDGNTNDEGAVPSNIDQNYDTEVTVPDNTGSLTKTGYTFDGWNTEAGGGGTAYVADDTFNMPVDGLTLYAQWATVTYDITYNLDGESNHGSNPATYTIGTSTITLLDPTKAGYTFGGWYSEAEFTNEITEITIGSTGNVTLYAQWTINEYTVTFGGNTNDGGAVPSNIDQNYDTEVTVPGNTGSLTKIGYSFDGWNTEAGGGGTSYVADDTFNMPVDGLTLYAQWTINEYTVTFDGNTNTGGAVPSNIDQNYDTEVTVPDNTGSLTKTGYTFDGWNTEAGGGGTAYVATDTFNMPTDGLTLYAQWATITYDITYNLDSGTNHGSNPATYTIETTTITLEDATKTGYTFGGWYSEAEFTNEITEITLGSTGDVTLYAKWTINEYTVSFDGNTNDGGAVPSNINQNYDTEVTVPGNTGSLTKTGYTFDGWNTEAGGGGTAYVATDTFNMPEGGLTLYAQWLTITYNITYNLDGGSNHGSNPATYTIETATITLLDPTKTGYTFGGWYSEAEFTSEITEITIGSTENVTLYAKWTTVTYDITYNLDGGSNHGSNPATYTIETATITLLDPTKTGYTFNDWYSEAEFTNEITEITLGSTGDVTLYAKLICDYTYNDNGDGTATITDYTGSDTALTIPDTLGGLSITILGSSAFQANSLTSVIIPNSVISIGSRAFQDNSLTSVTIGSGVTSIGDYAFVLNSSLTSIVIPDSVITIGKLAFQSASLTSLTIGNSVTTIGDNAFKANSLTSVTIPDSVTSIGDYIFYGNALTSVTIGSGLTSIPDHSFSSNDLTNVTIPNNITSIGYQAFFVNNLTDVTIPTSVTSIGSFAFYGNNLTNVTIGSGVTSIGVKAFDSNTLTSFELPSQAEGYMVDWTDGSTTYSSGDTVTDLEKGYDISGEVTPIVYDITYNLDGGSNHGSNPATYTIETATITLLDPTKTGYTFNDWYSEAEFTNEITEITLGSTGNVTLYAKFTINEYTVTFNGNTSDGGAVPSNIDQNYDTQVTVPGNTGSLTKTGYTFDGWNTEAGGGGTEYVATDTFNMPANNSTLYSQWTTVTYDITYNLNSGTNHSSNPATYKIDTATITLLDPTKTGYTFGGWYSETEFTNEITEITIGSTGDVTLYAQWTTVTYDITYNLDGGSNNGSNPATYTIITATITLLNPTKTGYTFEDWYSEIGFTNKITRITTGSIGNETLYAKWEIIPATPATTTPPAEEEEEEEIVEEVIPEEITEEEIVIVKQILEDTEEEGDDINQDEGVVIKVGDNSIDTKGKKTIHVYQDSGLELTIPVNSLSESSDDIDNVYAALGESVIKLTLNTVGDEYIGTIVAENMTGDNNIDILTIFKDSTSKKSILSISIDPYGYVYTINKDGNQVRIKDATITLYQVIDGERKLYSTSGQENPQKTDLEGQYSFMVEPGTYVIEVKADGYKDYRSEEIEVEKTIVELNIEIEESFDIFDYWFYMLTILIVLPVLFSLYSKFKHTH